MLRNMASMKIERKSLQSYCIDDSENDTKMKEGYK